MNLGGSDDESGAPERFGGLEGGAGRRGGTVGSSSRGLTRNAPGDPSESLLPSPIGASGTVGGEQVPGLEGPRFLGRRLGPAAIPEVAPGRDNCGAPAERSGVD